MRTYTSSYNIINIIYVQIDTAVDGGVVFNLSDKRKSKEILETSHDQDLLC